MNGRIESIRKMLREQPRDVFLHYSLGMEYASAGRHEEAAAEFRQCMDLQEDYLPAYVEAGKSLRAAGRLGEAREIFAAGMELATLQAERHMRDFIQQQLDALPKEQ